MKSRELGQLKARQTCEVLIFGALTISEEVITSVRETFKSLNTSTEKGVE
jgi:hypothetical protein